MTASYLTQILPHGKPMPDGYELIGPCGHHGAHGMRIREVQPSHPQPHRLAACSTLAGSGGEKEPAIIHSGHALPLTKNHNETFGSEVGI